MYSLFKSIQYPIAQLDSLIDNNQADVLKACFIDFKLYIYTNDAVDKPVVYLTDVIPTSNELKLAFNVVSIFDNDAALTLNLEFDLTQNYAADNEVRFYFDENDCENVNSKITKVNGYACFSNLNALNAAFLLFGPRVEMRNLMEPTTCSVVGNHKVDSFKAQYAKPLLLQTADSAYGTESAGVQGNVNFVAGSNCSITLQSFNNSVVISALRNANGTNEELCGIWRDAISNEDTLCDEAVYSLGGAYPDDNGNLLITGNYPLVVSSVDKADLPPSLRQQIAGTSYNHIKKVIYIGLPSTDTGVNCDVENVDIPCE
jgi:hypothetical protein